MNDKIKSRFVPIPKHPFDLGSHQQNSRAINALRNMQIVVGKEARIHSTDSNTIIEIPPSSPQLAPFYPFKIYQPSNFAGFTTGFTFDPVTYDGVVCNIDSTVPTDMTSIPPTVNPTTDAWRFWSIRSGLVDVRNNYDTSGGFPDSQEIGNWVGKWIPVIYVDDISQAGGTDGNEPANIDIRPTALPFDVQTDVSQYPPLIIPGDASSFYLNYCKLQLWIQIIPDGFETEAKVKIQGSLWDRFNPGFPVLGKNSIPIGYVDNGITFNNDLGEYSLTQFTPTQMVFDHQYNRYPTGSGNFAGDDFSTILNVRGIYSDTFISPSDLEQQYMYPGDVVIFKKMSPTSGGMYMWVYTYPHLFNSNYANTGLWKQVFSWHT